LAEGVSRLEDRGPRGVDKLPSGPSLRVEDSQGDARPPQETSTDLRQGGSSALEGMPMFTQWLYVDELRLAWYFQQGLAGVVLLIGLVLIRRGVWPRRIGDTPYCRTCGYNLTDRVSDRCPECGTPLSQKAIVHGERQRRPAFIAVGAIVAVGAATWLLLPLRTVKWYRYRPTAWVIADAQSTIPMKAGRALFELDSRITAGHLSAEQRTMLIDYCLRQQLADPLSPTAGDCIHALGRWHKAGVLSPLQEATFFEQMMKATLRVRPTVLEGEPLPFVLACHSRAPFAFECVLICEKVLIDGRAVPDGLWSRQIPERQTVFSLNNEPQLRNGNLPCGTPGSHNLTVSMRMEVHTSHDMLRVVRASSDAEKTPATSVYAKAIVLEAPFEVLSTEPPDYIKRVKDPTLGEHIRSYVEIHGLGLQRESEAIFCGDLSIERPPVDVAFEAFARIDGEEHRLGYIHQRKGEATAARLGFDVRLSKPPPQSYDIILRSSERAARGSVDLFEIWEGQLLFKDLPLKTRRVYPLTLPTLPSRPTTRAR